MRWEVSGADSATGEDVRVTVEARTAEEAEKVARYNGVLVSRVEQERPTAPNPAAVALEYRGKPPAASSPPAPPPAVPPPPPPAALVAGDPAADEKRYRPFDEKYSIFFCTLFAAVLHLAGWGRLMSLWLDAPSRAVFAPERFQDDNAWGATANALERLLVEAEVQRGVTTALLCIAIAVLLQVVANLVKGRATIRAAAARRASIVPPAG